DACPLAILMLDGGLRVTTWNPGAEKLLGWKREEIIGRPLPIPPNLTRPFFAAIRHRQPVRLDAHWEAKSGGRLDLAIWYAPLCETPEKLPGHVSLLMDVSEKHFLEKALLKESEREQRRIGKELQDHLAQYLLGAAFAVKALEGDLQREGSASAARLDELVRLLNDAVRQVQDISRGLHPVALDPTGLMFSLRELAERLNRSIPCQFLCENAVLIHDPQVALHAYRIAQDAAFFALRAAGGKKITLSLAQKSSTVTLEVRKHGPPGIPKLPADETSLKIMEYRAKAIDGHFAIHTQPRSGLRLTCAFPNA
ncbi:MAG TPA: PAS domain-containing protein, partial [Chthoniobacterales bacterium]